MNIGQIKVKIKELQANLQNETVIKELETKQFDLNNFDKTLANFYKNIEQEKDEHLLNELVKKINEQVEYTNKRDFPYYSHQFRNNAKFLITNIPIEINEDKQEENLIEDIEISEEEFTNRYNKLIELLNFEDVEANLILETVSQRKPFKVYKTKTKSLAIYAESSEKPMNIAHDRLLEVAFGRKKPTYASYENILISKIFDNTIFEFIQHDSLDKSLIEAMKDKLLKNENELIIVKNELEKIQEENKTLDENKQQFNNIIEKAQTLDSKIKAAEDKAKLGASTSYWKTKQDSHKKKFYIFGGISITLILLLISILSYIINSHYNQVNEKNKTQISPSQSQKITKVESNTNKEKKNLKEPEKITSKNSDSISSLTFDFSKIGWYALMIFASSSIFWIIRITVKIALSNLHLSEDAYERVVMIQTYLSFIQEGEIEEKDKELILSSLFRQSNIGIIKDESSVTITDIISAVKK